MANVDLPSLAGTTGTWFVVMDWDNFAGAWERVVALWADGGSDYNHATGWNVLQNGSNLSWGSYYRRSLRTSCLDFASPRPARSGCLSRRLPGSKIGNFGSWRSNSSRKRSRRL